MDLAPRPTNEETLLTCQRLAALIGVDRCWRLGGRWYFPLGGGVQVSIRGESGNRYRIEAWQGSTRRASLWALAGDEERLAGLFLDLTKIGAATAV